MTRVLAALALGACAAVVPISAHHSFSRAYHEDRSITLEGAVQQFQYRSPHTVLLFTARDPAGRMQTYAAEWSNPRRLGRQGVTKSTLMPGDVVIVTGSPGRVASEHKVHLKAIRRPADGWSWTGGRRRR